MLAIIPLADGFEEIEAVTVLDILRRADVAVRSVHLGEAAMITASRGVRLHCDGAWNPEEALTADLLVLPGGLRGTETLCRTETLLAVIRQRVAANRWVAAICAAPRVLDAAGVLEGKTITGYPGTLPSLAQAAPAVLIDPPLITSRGPATAMAFALALVRAVRGDATHDTVARGLLWASA